MIGAVMAKKIARSAFDTLNRHDLAKSMSGWAENGTWIVPGNVPISGEIKGKKAVESAFAKWMERFPKINFTVKEIFVSNIFALGGTNNIAVEWDIEETNHEGKEFHNSGVTIIRVKGGKAVEIKEYIFDAEVLEVYPFVKIWEQMLPLVQCNPHWSKADLPVQLYKIDRLSEDYLNTIGLNMTY